MDESRTEVPVIVLLLPKSARRTALFFLVLTPVLLLSWKVQAEGWKRLALFLGPIFGAVLLLLSPILLKVLFHRGPAGILWPDRILLLCTPFTPLVIEDEDWPATFEEYYAGDNDLVLAVRVDQDMDLNPYLRVIGTLTAWINPHRQAILGPFVRGEARTVADLPLKFRRETEKVVIAESERRKLREEELAREIHEMMAALDKRLAMPKSREEADERFRDVPLGHWSDSRYSVAPTDVKMGFLASGAGYAHYHHPFEIEETLFRWRPVSPGKLEVTLEGAENWCPLEFEIMGPDEEGEFSLKFETDLSEISYFGMAKMLYGGLLGADKK